eukprot:CFRG4572T1
MTGENVVLHVYDLSQGMARSFSQQILGQQIDGIWHTGVVVYGREFYFAGVIELGVTHRSQEEFLAHLETMVPKFNAGTYHLLENNCNNFSCDVSQFLVKKKIPSYITGLPNDVMNGPFGAVLRPFINQMQSQIRDASGQQQVNFNHNNSSTRTTTIPHAQVSLTQQLPVVLRNALANPMLSTTSTNRVKIQDKLNEFAVTSGLSPLSNVSSPHLEEVLHLCVSLPSEKVFPALDLLRLLILDDVGNCVRVSHILDSLLTAHVIGQPTHSRATLLMALRCVQNCFAYEHGIENILKSHSDTTATENVFLDRLLALLETSLSAEHPDVRSTAAALTCNLAGTNIRFPSLSLTEDQSIRLTHVVSEALQHSENISHDRIYHLLLCSLGGLVSANAQCRDFAVALGISIVNTGLPTETLTLANEVRTLVTYV